MTIELGALPGSIAAIVGTMILVGVTLALFIHRELSEMRERMARLEGLVAGFIHSSQETIVE